MNYDDMKITILEPHGHVYVDCKICGIASEYPKNNWYKVFYTIKNYPEIHSIAELKEDVKICMPRETLIKKEDLITRLKKS